MKRFLPIFRQAAERLDATLKKHGLVSRTGVWLDSAVLEVMKSAWGQPLLAQAAAKAGIFFSVWIEEKGLKQNRVFYNIHALRLRELDAYALQSREFASAFRARFASASGPWPNVTTDHGPQTLMQGWIALREECLVDDIVELTERFLPLSVVLDRLLEERRKPRRGAAG